MQRWFQSLSLALLAFSISPALAQDTGVLSGTVTDTSSAVVANAQVIAINVDNNFETTTVTNAEGLYRIPFLRPGTYRMRITAPGFKTFIRENVDLRVGATLPIDARMEVGALAESIQVTAASPLVETDSSQRGQVISGDQTRALPLISREYSSLALLTTGVKLGGSSLTTGNTPREGAFNVNGLRSVFNNFLIDGVDNNAYGTSNQGFSNQVMQPTPDAIGEFKVVTNNMSAEYGRSAGATINVAYASGTNQFRGSAWEFMRRTELNATGAFRPDCNRSLR